jgi:uncharacterized membrane protein
MEQRRWVNPGQPQTLQIAVFLLYFRGIFAAVFGALTSTFGLLYVAGSIGGAFGIANEKKWGYGLGIAISVLPFVLPLLTRDNPLSGDVIHLMLSVALVALLLHPQSRDYQRIWFK